MSKFQRGDTVRIVVTERQPGWAVNGSMDKYIGATVTVADTDITGGFWVYDSENDRQWYFIDAEAEIVEQDYEPGFSITELFESK